MLALSLKQSDEELKLLEAHREEGFELVAVGEWMFRRSKAYAGAEQLLVSHLETCKDERLAGTLMALLGRRRWKPALPELIARLRRAQGRTAEFRIASVIAKIGVEGHEEGVLTALEDVRSIASHRVLNRALRKAGVEPPLTGFMAAEQRILAAIFASIVAVVGALSLVLAPLIARRAGWVVLLPEIPAGVTSLALAGAVWRQLSWMARLYPLWAVTTVVFHFTYQIGAHLFSWKQFVVVESAIVVILVLCWRVLIQGVFARLSR